MDYSAEVIKFPATTLSNKGLDVPELTEPYHIVFYYGNGRTTRYYVDISNILMFQFRYHHCQPLQDKEILL